MRQRYRVAAVCLILAVLVSTGSAVGDGGLTATPAQLRALYVQRLVNYVSWPEGVGPEPGEPFIIAAVDPAGLRPYFDTPEAVSRFQIVQWPAPKYHILILLGPPEREIAAILKRVAGKPVLTVSQDPINLRLGAVVNFSMEGGKLRLEVNPAAAQAAGLSISSRLLQLVRIYEGEDDG